MPAFTFPEYRTGTDAGVIPGPVTVAVHGVCATPEYVTGKAAHVIVVDVSAATITNRTRVADEPR